MITVVQLAIEVNAPTEKAEQNLSHLSQSAEKSGGALSRLGGFAKSAAASLLGFLGSQTILGGIGGVGGLVSYIFGSDEQLQNTTTAFTKLLGSSKAAKDEIADLQQFAAATPLEFPDVAAATQKLLGYGFQLKQTKPLITAIGDALAATGHLDPATLQQVIDVFGQMHASVHLQTQDLRQLQSVGINAFALLAQALKPTKTQLDDLVKKGLIPAGDAQQYLSGKTKLTQADIQQLVTDGLIPSQQGIDAMTKAIEQNPIYKGGMAAQSQTTAGKLSTLKDNLTQALQTMSAPIFDEFGNIVGKIGDAVSKPAFKEFAKTVGQDIAGAMKTTIDVTRNVVGWFIQWHEPVLIVAGALTAFFIPALIKSGVESVVAGTKIALNFVANLIKSGVEGYQAAGKIALWVGQTVASGVQASIAGGKIAGSWIASVVQGGNTAKAKAVEVDAFTTAEAATGTTAETSAIGVDALAVSEDGLGTSAATAASEVTGLATAEAGLGDAATGAVGAAGAAGAAGAGGVGMVGLGVAIGAVFQLASADWLGSQIADWLKGVTGQTQEAGMGFINLLNPLGDTNKALASQLDLLQQYQDTMLVYKLLNQINGLGGSLLSAYMNANNLDAALLELQDIERYGGGNPGGPTGTTKYTPGSKPHFASGGIMPYSGVAWVGEWGSEPVFLPQGSRVISHQEAISALQQHPPAHSGDTFILNGPTSDQLWRQFQAMQARKKALVFGGRR